MFLHYSAIKSVFFCLKINSHKQAYHAYIEVKLFYDEEVFNLKKILCMLLIMTNALILSSCARLKIEDDDSSVQSTSSTAGSSSTSSSSSAGSTDEEGTKSTSTSQDSSKDKESDKGSGSEGVDSSLGNESKPNINININNGTGGNSDKTVQYESTKQYYLQKLDGIEAGMSDLDSYRAGSNADMKKAAGIEYKRWDDALNEIYSVLKGQLSAGEMSSLEKDELNWIKYKESDAKKCADEFKGGSAEPLIYTSRLAELTKERCYYLVNNYMR